MERNVKRLKRTHTPTQLLTQRNDLNRHECEQIEYQIGIVNHMRLKVAGRAGTASVKRASAGQESRGGCLAVTGSVGWVGCDRCMAMAVAVATAVAAWGWGNLGGGLGRLDDSSLSWTSRTSLSGLRNHLGVDTHRRGGGSSLNGPLDIS